MKYVPPILLSLVLSAAGCGEQASSTGAESSEKSASAQSVSSASATALAPAQEKSATTVSVTAKAIEATPGKNLSGKATVTLLEAGAKDNRAPLRYKFKAGHSNRWLCE